LTVAILIFVTCSALFLYSYFAYSPLLELLSKGISPIDKGEKQTELRKIAVVISAYNEEKTIKEVLHSILDALHCDQTGAIYIGSDGSTDQTNDIITELSKTHQNIHFTAYERMGKGNVINKLMEQHQLNNDEYILVLMDANILVEKNCVQQLLLESQYDQVGMVGASVYPLKNDINTESLYILKENQIKYLEGLIFGTTIGVFGACYAMKGEYFRMIPSHYITDDLFESFSVIRQKKQVVFSQRAICKETIDADVINEFNRKKRYGAGNIQIFFHFIDLLNPWSYSLGFIYCYWNHKLVRWFAPWWGLSLWISSFFLTNYNPIFFVVTWIGWILIGIIVFNLWLIKKNQKPLLNRLFYYLMMNIALLMGALNYIKGINTNVWNRSNRN